MYIVKLSQGGRVICEENDGREEVKGAQKEAKRVTKAWENDLGTIWARNEKGRRRKEKGGREKEVTRGHNEEIVREGVWKT